VHRVTALGQLFPQFRTDNAAAAISWIDRDADVHWFRRSMQLGASRRQIEIFGSLIHWFIDSMSQSTTHLISGGVLVFELNKGYG
jgi:hypothetical protein